MILHYRDLIFYKAYSDLKAEAESTFLGIIWWIIDPIVETLIYYIVFGVLLNRGSRGDIPFVVFLMTGVVPYMWFSTTIMDSAPSILNNLTLVRQTAFHKFLFPTSRILTNSFKFMLSLAVMFTFLWFYGFKPQIHFLAMFILLPIELCLITAITLNLSAIVPFYPDILHFVRHTIRLLFFMTGIFFAPEDVAGKYVSFVYWNPMAVLVASYREVLLYNRWPTRPIHLLVTVIVSIILIALGMSLIKRNDEVYAKRVRK